MKKIIYSSLFTLLTIGVFAQEAADKKVQAGLVFGSGINFQRMNTRNIDNDGVGANLSVGAIVNIGFNNTVGFSTGLEFDFDGSNYKTTKATYYEFNDTKILRENESSSTSRIYRLSERNQQAIYLTLPTMMIFRTNYIGYFRYFGKIGLRNSFLLSSKVNDKGIAYDPLGLPAEMENTSMKLNSGNDLLFYRGSVGLAGGAEWNFIGSTCLALEIGYYYGFTPLFYNTKESKRFLFNQEPLGAREYINNVATQSQLLFKLSILF